MIQLIRLIVALVLWISRASKKQGISGTKRKTTKLIEKINNNEVDLNAFKADYILRTGMETLPADQLLMEDNELEKAFLQLKSTEKFKIRMCKKITRGEYLFIVDSYIHDIEVTGISGNTKETIVENTYIFIFKKNSKTNSYEVYSDLHDAAQDKTLRVNFSKLLFDLINKNKVEAALPA
ncbi:MAG: hypothetical protein JWP12_661 [Bacteroidetes bacterium]|nr:hypothetical protein [Bacteroidota bacterium]